MFTQTVRWIFVLTASLFVTLAATIRQPEQASAQIADVSDNSCLTCHEDLYYNHDEGCWYCMTEAHKDRCVDCHEGNPASMKVDEAHLGMLPHPQENGGAKCLECHEQGDLARVLNTFEASAGFDKVVKTDAFTTAVAAQPGFPEIAPTTPTLDRKWIVGAFVAFGLWLALVLFSPLKP